MCMLVGLEVCVCILAYMCDIDAGVHLHMLVFRQTSGGQSQAPQEGCFSSRGCAPRPAPAHSHFGNHAHEALVLVGPVPSRVAKLCSLELCELLEEVHLGLHLPVPWILGSSFSGQSMKQDAESSASFCCSIMIPLVAVQQNVKIHQARSTRSHSVEVSGGSSCLHRDGKLEGKGQHPFGLGPFGPQLGAFSILPNHLLAEGIDAAGRVKDLVVLFELQGHALHFFRKGSCQVRTGSPTPTRRCRSSLG